MNTPTSSAARAAAPAPALGLGVYPLIAAGLCASLIGIGLARFAYTPLIPPLIAARWFTADAVVFLAAANLLGYLLGAICGKRLASAIGSVATLRAMMLVTALSFLACAMPVSPTWFFSWRLVSGVTGGAIMVLVGSVVLPHVPAARKGMAAGAIFLGLGLGIAASGTMVPLLLRAGLSATWIGLAVVSLILTLLTWGAWPPNARPPKLDAVVLQREERRSLLHIYGQYGLMAIGVVPSMVFLVDYAVRGLHWTVNGGAFLWIVFGIGALVGPLSYGATADRLGFARTIRLTLVLQVVAGATLVSATSAWIITPAVFLLGTFPPGAVPLVLGRVNELVKGPPAAQQAAWGRATMAFALVQAAAGYGDSALLTLTGGNFKLLFAGAAAAFVGALVWDLVASPSSSKSNRGAHTERPSN
ncbi:YbfB/YjiJ family MFS transporter [Variovorax defluvii]|uniref:YbfB/YjiJ family MFS transporter n=2 Tax=Variovorax defluvii TaxID=913761 RepID=A0ABP8IDS1_9BURK